MSSKTIFRKSTDIISLPSGEYTVEELESYLKLANMLIEKE